MRGPPPVPAPFLSLPAAVLVEALVGLSGKPRWALNQVEGASLLSSPTRVLFLFD